MGEMVVKLTWDSDDLGPTWMNLDNLALCLFNEGWSIGSGLVELQLIRHSSPNMRQPEEDQSVVVWREEGF